MRIKTIRFTNYKYCAKIKTVINKIKKITLAVKSIIKKPQLINLLINHDENWLLYLNKKHPNYTQLKLVEIQDLTKQQQASLSAIAFLDGSSMLTDLFLLQSLALRFENCSYFEIGTWRGESVINVAKVAKECHTLNLSEKEIIQLGWGEKYAKLQACFSKNHPNIKHWYGDTKTFNFKEVNQKFDLIFIDGNHHYDYVKHDTQQVFKHLVHDNSIVVWHDYAHHPESVRHSVLAGILDGTPKELHQHIYHASNTKCAVMIKEYFKTQQLEHPSTPTKSFSVHLDLKPLV